MNRTKIAMTLEVLQACEKPVLLVLQGIPPEQLRWKPAAESRSIGEICRHLVRVNAWFLRRLGVEPQVADVPAGGAEELAAGLERSHRQVREVVQACEDDGGLLVERVALDGKDREKLGVAALHIAQHDLYHLAQIVYLRRAQDRSWPAPLKEWEAATHVIGDYLLGVK
ncbi:MAG: hypothetical protein DKINENOH_03745 [bacterium]|nr:hypothetical protein [bacterium]